SHQRPGHHHALRNPAPVCATQPRTRHGHPLHFARFAFGRHALPPHRHSERRRNCRVRPPIANIWRPPACLHAETRRRPPPPPGFLLTALPRSASSYPRIDPPAITTRPLPRSGPV